MLTDETCKFFDAGDTHATSPFHTHASAASGTESGSAAPAFVPDVEEKEKLMKTDAYLEWIDGKLDGPYALPDSDPSADSTERYLVRMGQRDGLIQARIAFVDLIMAEQQVIEMEDQS